MACPTRTVVAMLKPNGIMKVGGRHVQKPPDARRRHRAEPAQQQGNGGKKMAVSKQPDANRQSQDQQRPQFRQHGQFHCRNNP